MEEDNLISCDKIWETENNVDYRLTIDSGIQDKEGNILDEETYYLVAKFRTIKAQS